MDLEAFHIHLFGQNSATPKWAKLNDTHRMLYQGFHEGKRGYTATEPGEQNFDQFLAVFVLALHQSFYPSREEVLLVVTPAAVDWCTLQLESIARKMFRARRKVPREQSQPLIDSLKSIVIGARPIQMTKSPVRWVSYGFTNDTYPSWFLGTLID